MVDIFVNSSILNSKGVLMSFAIAKKKTEFWHAYYENRDERFIFKEKDLSPEEYKYLKFYSTNYV